MIYKFINILLFYLKTRKFEVQSAKIFFKWIRILSVVDQKSMKYSVIIARS